MYVDLLFVWLEVRGVATVCLYVCGSAVCLARGNGRGYCLSVCVYVDLLFVWLEVRGVATVCLSVCMWTCCLSGWR